MASQTGLANLGATCFLNTGIQCLRHSRLVREHLGSFNEEDLKALGRLHDTKQAINAINHAKEIFERFSFDLIWFFVFECKLNYTFLFWNFSSV